MGLGGGLGRGLGRGFGRGMGFGGGDKIFNNMLDRVRCAAALRPRKIALADAPRMPRCAAQKLSLRRTRSRAARR